MQVVRGSRCFQVRRNVLVTYQVICSDLQMELSGYVQALLHSSRFVRAQSMILPKAVKVVSFEGKIHTSVFVF